MWICKKIVFIVERAEKPVRKEKSATWGSATLFARKEWTSAGRFVQNSSRIGRTVGLVGKPATKERSATVVYVRCLAQRDRTNVRAFASIDKPTICIVGPVVWLVRVERPVWGERVPVRAVGRIVAGFA